MASRFQHAAPALIIWSIVAAMAFDMAPVLQAQVKINNAEKTSHHIDNLASIEKEIRAIQACRTAQEAESITDNWMNREWRDCVLAESKDITTQMGTVYLATAASAWLHLHPKDAEVKFTAIASVGRARERLLTEYEQFYKIYDDMDEVAAKSKIFSINGYKKSGSHFEMLVKQLNRAENSVYIPSVTQYQEDWASKQRAKLGGEKHSTGTAI